MYRYQVKPGEEHRTFGGDGVRNLGDGIVESDQELNSVHLTPIEDKPVAPVAPQAPAVPAVAAPAQQAQLPAPAQPANQGEAK